MDTETFYFYFRRVYSHKFLRQPHSKRFSHFRCPFVTAPGLLSLTLTDLFTWVNQPTRELLKTSARGQVLSIISRIIFYDSSNELPVNFWINIFWILHLISKINRWPIHYVPLGKVWTRLSYSYGWNSSSAVLRQAFWRCYASNQRNRIIKQPLSGWHVVKIVNHNTYFVIQ